MQQFLLKRDCLVPNHMFTQFHQDPSKYLARKKKMKKKEQKEENQQEVEKRVI